MLQGDNINHNEECRDDLFGFCPSTEKNKVSYAWLIVNCKMYKTSFLVKSDIVDLLCLHLAVILIDLGLILARSVYCLALCQGAMIVLGEGKTEVEYD